jgi:hypothetical protein
MVTLPGPVSAVPLWQLLDAQVFSEGAPVRAASGVVGLVTDSLTSIKIRTIVIRAANTFLEFFINYDFL